MLLQYYSDANVSAEHEKTYFINNLYFRMTLTTAMHCFSNVCNSCLSENLFSVMLFYLCLSFDMY